MKPETLKGLMEYLHQKRPPGDFLRAVLENDLRMAFHRADSENKKDLEQIVVWCLWELPSNSWGSPEKVADWLLHSFDVLVAWRNPSLSRES